MTHTDGSYATDADHDRSNMQDRPDAINTDETTDIKSGCELCARIELPLTRHHLIPLARHNKARTQRSFSREEMKTDIAMLCRPCHSQIHRLFDNHELVSYYHTIERLQAHSEMQKFINWVKKRPAGLRIRVRR